MKFVRGMIIGTALTIGAAMMYSEGMINKRKLMKKGRQIAKKIGAL